MADKDGKYEHLTDLQRKFALGIVKGLAPADAMQAAGSSAKSRTALARQAYEYSNKPHVKAYIEELQKNGNERALLEKEEVIDGLRKVISAGLAEGDPEEAKNLPAVNKALELLGNHLGMFKQVVRTETEQKPGEALKDSDDGGVDKDIQRFNKIMGFKNDKEA